jgi:uncharacterized SAM-binding protein YcdF (DUF218 family)
VVTDKRFEAIIILGKGITADDSLPELVRHEIDYAAQLSRQQPVSAVIFTGDYWGLGVNPGTLPEAVVMYRYASKLFPAAVQLLCEEQAKDTIGNILYGKALLDEHGWRNLLILSSADHAARVQYIARQVFDTHYNVQFHGHQHSTSPSEYRRTRRYERLAGWYARWFFTRLHWTPRRPWQQLHFMYRDGAMVQLVKAVLRRRPAHR